MDSSGNFRLTKENGAKDAHSASRSSRASPGKQLVVVAIIHAEHAGVLHDGETVDLAFAGGHDFVQVVQAVEHAKVVIGLFFEPFFLLDEQRVCFGHAVAVDGVGGLRQGKAEAGIGTAAQQRADIQNVEGAVAVFVFLRMDDAFAFVGADDFGGQPQKL